MEPVIDAIVSVSPPNRIAANIDRITPLDVCKNRNNSIEIAAYEVAREINLDA